MLIIKVISLWSCLSKIIELSELRIYYLTSCPIRSCHESKLEIINLEGFCTACKFLALKN